MKSNQKNSELGPNLRYEIVRQARWPSEHMNNTPTTNLLLTLCYATNLIVQEFDQDMTDSSSPPSHKRIHLTNQQSNQYKKTKSDLQSEHARYVNQDIWLGFQTMELLATDAEIPPQEIHLSIREMIKRGYKEAEAAEAHTAKVSFPRVP